LVSHWLENGNVIEFLKKEPSANRLNLVRDVVKASEYLHDIGIVHGDLKVSTVDSNNVLINSVGRACLCDFGLTSVYAEVSLKSSSSNAGGNMRYQAPELFFDARLSPSTDVYAL
ncbi:kinase-like protein, partial [Punctularia strigosozonata HHB-11173 SS5]|uniref:kinase-like protein n=1 Tax=Punctularia strigosozonata (strain HHB-11173) TaxID=741275 RepID=UPI00044171AA